MKQEFAAVIGRVRELITQSNPSSADGAVLHEILEKMEALATKFERLMELNETLSCTDPLAMDISMVPGTDELVIKVGGNEQMRLKLNRASPETPVEMADASTTGAFTPGKRQADDPIELKEAEKELVGTLEGYYYDAHRVMKLIPKVSCGRKTKIGGAGLVRNLLIEHPPDGELYTFGWSNNGPRVKPLSRGTLKHNDDGLVPNTIEFLNEVSRCLA